MSQLWIVVGDKTTHGGVVITGSLFTDIDGKPVARVGDKVTCPNCGPTTIVTGDPTINIDGAIVARHNDSTACGSTLIAASQFRVLIDTGGGGAGGKPGGAGNTMAAGAKAAASAAAKRSAIKARAAAAAAAATAPSALKPFDEQFRAVDASGQPLPGLHYRIQLPDGTQVYGQTDEEGKTRRVATESPEKLQLFWEEADSEDQCESDHHDLPGEC